MSAKPKRHDLWPEAPSRAPVKGIRLVMMQLEHVDEILRIEEESFPIPWTRDAFDHDLTDNELAHYFTMFRSKEIAGYSGLWLIDTIAHLTTICIEKNHRGLGLGKWLLLKTMQIGADAGARRFTLEVRESNVEAIRLYESAGYSAVGRRELYYREIGEDALIMWTGRAPYVG